MGLLDLDFEWPVYSRYCLNEDQLRENGREEIIPDPNSSVLETKKPFAIHPTLYIDFANLDGSTDSLLKFASIWGLLGCDSWTSNGYPYDDEGRVWGEALSWWRVLIEEMRRAIDDPSYLFRRLSFIHIAGDGQHQDKVILPKEAVVADLEALLVRNSITDRLELRIRPRTLIEGINLQFALAKSSGLDLETCDFCKQPFEAGKGGGRRRKARFCSDKCRSDFHNAQKRRIP